MRGVLHRACTHFRHFERSRSLCVAHVKVEPVVSFDFIESILAVSPAPVPRIERYCWPRPDTAKCQHAWIEFRSADARSRAHQLLYGRSHGSRFLMTFFPVAKEKRAPAYGPQPPEAAPLPELRADLQVMTNADRLEKARKEAGAKPISLDKR